MATNGIEAQTHCKLRLKELHKGINVSETCVTLSWNILTPVSTLI